MPRLPVSVTRKNRTPEPQRGLRGIPNVLLRGIQDVLLDIVCTRYERD